MQKNVSERKNFHIEITCFASDKLSRISMLLSNVYIKEIDRLSFEFLWENKPAKIKRGTITATYTMGWLEMPDIFTIKVVYKIKWIKQLLMESLGKWPCLTWYSLNIAKGKLRNKQPPIQQFKCLPPLSTDRFLIVGYNFMGFLQNHVRKSLMNLFLIINLYVVEINL